MSPAKRITIGIALLVASGILFYFHHTTGRLFQAIGRGPAMAVGLLLGGLALWAVKANLKGRE